jgi:hypothetical protein
LILLAVILLFAELFLFVQHDFPLILGETDGIGYMERSSEIFQVEQRYAEFRAHRLLGMRPRDLPRSLAKLRPTYIVYDALHTSGKVPLLKVLLDPKNKRIPAELEPVFEVDSLRKLVVYRFTTVMANRRGWVGQ